MADKKAKNVIRGGLVSPRLHAEAVGAAEARRGEGGFRNNAMTGKRSKDRREDARTE